MRVSTGDMGPRELTRGPTLVELNCLEGVERLTMELSYTKKRAMLTKPKDVKGLQRMVETYVDAVGSIILEMTRVHAR